MTIAPHIVTAYFARVRDHSTGRWSAVHWMRNGEIACGKDWPEDYDLDLPPEPMLTCAACQRLNREMQESGR